MKNLNKKEILLNNNNVPYDIIGLWYFEVRIEYYILYRLYKF